MTSLKEPPSPLWSWGISTPSLMASRVMPMSLAPRDAAGTAGALPPSTPPPPVGPAADAAPGPAAAPAPGPAAAVGPTALAAAAPAVVTGPVPSVVPGDAELLTVSAPALARLSAGLSATTKGSSRPSDSTTAPAPSRTPYVPRTVGAVSGRGLSGMCRFLGGQARAIVTAVVKTAVPVASAGAVYCWNALPGPSGTGIVRRPSGPTVTLVVWAGPPSGVVVTASRVPGCQAAAVRTTADPLPRSVKPLTDAPAISLHS